MHALNDSLAEVLAPTAQGSRHCPVCLATVAPREVARIRCNVRQFRLETFEVWRCAACRSLHCEDVGNLPAYYAAYPIRAQGLDYFVRAWYRVVLHRLRAAGLQKHHRILDYGCNQGLLIQFLKESGFEQCFGYDPYIERFQSASVLESTYDFVLSLDVIEHDGDPQAFIDRLKALMKPGGKLCLESPNADGIDLQQAEEYLHALHVPYHIHLLSQRALQDLAVLHGLKPEATYTRWYMDSWWPATSRRLFESLMTLNHNDLDSGYEPPRLGLFFRHPSLFLHLFFGYFSAKQKTDHMMMIFTAAA